MLRLLKIVRLWLVLLGLCAGSVARADSGPVVLAAASLQESLNRVADAWARHGHARPVLSFAASSALARQVAAGAPADLFVSADEEWMDFVARDRVVAGTRADLLRNRLVIVAPRGSRVALAVQPGMALAAVLGPGGRLAMGQFDTVPAGRYAKLALTRLGVWPQVAGRIAGAENVRAALALVARGEAPLGMVYMTDALAEPRVRVVAVVPERWTGPIVYPMARLTTSRHGDAEGFRRFLLSGEAQAIFATAGFGNGK